MFDMLSRMAAAFSQPESGDWLQQRRREIMPINRVEELEGLADVFELKIDFDPDAEDDVELETFSGAVEAVAALRAAEHARRLAFAVVIRTLDEVAESGVVGEHGHSSAKAMCGAVNDLSGSDLYGLEQIRLMNRRCDMIKDACFNGDLSEDHLRLLGRVYANRRVRSLFVDKQGWFLNKARQLDFKRFSMRIARWVEVNDDDGPDPNTGHEKRTASSVQDHFSKMFQRTSTQGPLVGAAMTEIDAAYLEAEFTKDWEAAKAIHGDAVCNDLLARTGAQRRADAQAQIYADAISNPNKSVGFNLSHMVVWDQATYEEQVRRFAGAEPIPFDIDTMRCETIDGVPLEVNEAFLDSLINGVRRVVIDAKGVVINMSEKRFFTGFARIALNISQSECEWPGCHVPGSRCQADHTTPKNRGGPTTQQNASMFCRRHNRHKERGYTVWRDRDTGNIRIKTPTGYEITKHPD